MPALIVVLLIAGLCLFLAEILVPGWVLGILGGLITTAAVVLVYLQYGVPLGTVTLCIVACFGIGGFILWMKYFPNSRFGRKLTNSSITGEPRTAAPSDLKPGIEGVALTDLRPAGTARFGMNRVDVVSEAVFISKDAKICISLVEGSRVVVRQISSFQPEQPLA